MVEGICVVVEDVMEVVEVPVMFWDASILRIAFALASAVGDLRGPRMLLNTSATNGTREIRYYSCLNFKKINSFSD